MPEVLDRVVPGFPGIAVGEDAATIGVAPSEGFVRIVIGAVGAVDPDAEGLAVLDGVFVGKVPAAILRHLNGLEDFGVRVGVCGPFEEVGVFRDGRFRRGGRIVVEHDVAVLGGDSARHGAEVEVRHVGIGHDVGFDVRALAGEADGRVDLVGDAEVGVAFEGQAVLLAHPGCIATNHRLKLGEGEVIREVECLHCPIVADGETRIGQGCGVVAGHVAVKRGTRVGDRVLIQGDGVDARNVAHASCGSPIGGNRVDVDAGVRGEFLRDALCQVGAEAVEDLLAIHEDLSFHGVIGHRLDGDFGLSGEVCQFRDGEGLGGRIDRGGQEVADDGFSLAIPGDGDGHVLTRGVSRGDRIGIGVCDAPVLIGDGGETLDGHAVGFDVIDEIAFLGSVFDFTGEPGVDVPVLEAVGFDADPNANREKRGGREDDNDFLGGFGFAFHLLTSLVRRSTGGSAGGRSGDFVLFTGELRALGHISHRDGDGIVAVLLGGELRGEVFDLGIGGVEERAFLFGEGFVVVVVELDAFAMLVLVFGKDVDVGAVDARSEHDRSVFSVRESRVDDFQLAVEVVEIRDLEVRKRVIGIAPGEGLGVLVLMGEAGFDGDRAIVVFGGSLRDVDIGILMDDVAVDPIMERIA